MCMHIQAHEGRVVALLANVSSRCFHGFPAAMLVSLGGHQHGVSILSSINLRGTFRQINKQRFTAQT